MKKLFRPYLAFLLMGSLLATTACKEDEEPEPDHDHELITTVTLTLVPTDTSKPTVTATWEDLDGVGGTPATIDDLVLSANTIYTGSISFESEEDHGDHSHGHDLTDEIREEGDAHELFYVVTPQGLVSFEKTDVDDNNRPIGLETRVITTGAGTGTVRVVLKHQPGLKSNNSDINTGETDVDITFNTTVQ
ncbi:hypothetical protein FVR03_02365 [Pontibacter qinzhouensis]|uniref:Type 1 periplasmic binding fold superfamily protein n=1 Tax=Pontibacter qinzhouensis TaxID=2603253 RepID=A0A5C8KA65_9BACT|nr:hypothetical protein [Pontibacter qinzhouensis]TXK51948.1 hypothetical protein FVR03_02365 [Pontibacter qinzhouensis]